MLLTGSVSGSAFSWQLAWCMCSSPCCLGDSEEWMGLQKGKIRNLQFCTRIWWTYIQVHTQNKIE